MTAPIRPNSTAPATDGAAPPIEIRPRTAGEPADGNAPAWRTADSSTTAGAAIASVGRHWGLLVTLGVLSILAGLAIITWPQETVLVVAAVVGIQLLLNGVIRIVQSFAADDGTGGERVLLALVGIVSILVGVLCLRNILQTVGAVALLVGIFMLVAGIVDLIGGLLPDSVPGRGWRLLSGVLGVIGGIAILAYPGISLAALAVLLGVWLLLYGVVFVAMGFAVRREARGA